MEEFPRGINECSFRLDLALIFSWISDFFGELWVQDLLYEGNIMGLYKHQVYIEKVKCLITMTTYSADLHYTGESL